MDKLLLIMPISLRPYAKAAVAVLGATLTAALSLWGDSPELATIASFLTALGVYAQPNEKVEQ